MKIDRLSVILAVCAVAACSDSSDGASASQESLRRGESVDGGAVLGRDHDRDADESAEEALTDGGHHRGRFEDGGHKHGRLWDHFGDAGCRGLGRDDRGYDHDDDGGDDRGDDRGDDHRGPGHDGKGHDGGAAP